MPDFPVREIQIREGANLWGPVRFEFTACSSDESNDGLLPYGSIISTVTVKAYVGTFNPGNDPANFTEISDLLIETGANAPYISDSVNVDVWFQYPGDTYSGSRITLEFALTLASGAEYPFYFQYIKVP